MASTGGGGREAGITRCRMADFVQQQQGSGRRRAHPSAEKVAIAAHWGQLQHIRAIEETGK